jgi:succinylarginine dihydrolase
MFKAYNIRAAELIKCDKCDKLSEPENPIIELESVKKLPEGGGYHCIRIHVKCFEDVATQLNPKLKEKINDGTSDIASFTDSFIRNL